MPPPVPTAAAVGEMARLATIQLRQNIPQRAQDRTYLSEIRRFKEWVDLQRANNIIPQAERYISRENVDLFFATVIAHRVVTPQTARRTVNALQTFARDEYLGNQEPFMVEGSERVKEALEAQSQLYANHRNSLPLDPYHKLPTDMISRTERSLVVHTILQENRLNWKNMCISWTGCESMMVRHDSMRKFRLCDVVTNLTHAPSKEGPHDREMLNMVYRAGVVHKDRQKKKRIVGCYRHKDWELCFTTFVAASLFTRLYANADINFHSGTGNRAGDAPPAWYELKLLEGWNTSSAAESAYKAILNYLDISWEKVCHLRKAGTEFASSEGELRGEEVTTMTKHAGGQNTSKRFSESYSTELYPPLLRVMSGSKKDGEYSVARTKIAVDEYCNRHGRVAADLIFPGLQNWKDEQQAPTGDKSKAAANFLLVTLPFLAKVLIQDGIYWIENYPTHTVSRHLLHVLPTDYPQWAATQRQWVRQQQ